MKEKKKKGNVQGKQRKGRIARIIASLLAVTVTVTSAAPFGMRIKDTESVYAAEAEGQTLNADVTIVSQLSGGFLHDRETVSVNSGLAEKYDYADAIDSAKAVSALDVLVAAYELVLGEEFNEETAKEYLSLSDGFVDNFFDAGKGNFSFAINKAQPNNGIEGQYGYSGTAVNQTVVHSGDTVEFFAYADPYYMDYYTWFETDGKQVDTLYMETGNEAELMLKGYYFAWYGAYAPDSLESFIEAIKEVEVYAGDEFIDVTDDEGKIAVSFSKAGEYILSVPSEDDYGMYYLMPNLKIIVEDELTDSMKAENAAQMLSWGDIRDENGSIYNVSTNLTLPTSVTLVNGDTAEVTWKSSDTELIGNTGEVSLDNISEDTEVTLSAFVTVGSSSVQKDFHLQIYAGGAKDITEYSDDEQKAQAEEITAALAVNETVAGLLPDLFLQGDFLIGYLACGGTLTAQQEEAVLRKVQVDASSDMTSSVLGTLAKDALVLCAMAKDPCSVKIYSDTTGDAGDEASAKTVSLIDIIAKAPASNLSIYNAPYVLLAYAANDKCSPESSATAGDKSDAVLTQDFVIRYILDNQEISGDKAGSFKGTYDVGDTASVVLGFAGYQDYESESVRSSEITDAIEAAFDYIGRKTGGLADFGSSNYNAYIVLAGSMLAKNPQEITKGYGYPDVIDALLADSLGTGKGFRYTGNTVNLMATADAMRALTAFKNYLNDESAVKGNIYDFTDKVLVEEENWPKGKVLTDLFIAPPTKLVYEKGEELDTAGMTVTAKYSDGTTKILAEGEYKVGTFASSTAGEKEINVTYSETSYGITETKSASFAVIVADDSGSTGGGSQVSEPKVSTVVKNANGKVLAEGTTVIKKNSTTVINVLKQVLASAGITATIKDGNYVVSIDGLSEFDMGGNSGWMVRVDGTLIETSAAQYKLKGGEEIEWFYTKDWTKVPGSSGIKDAAAVPLTEKNKEISEAALKADEFIQGTEGKGTSYHHALFGEEWFLIGRVRGENGERVPAAYKEGYYEEARAAIAKSGGVLDQRRVTENARVVIALTAIGKDASAIGGQNLLLSLADMQRVTNQGLNGAVWTLIALDSGDYDIPQSDELQKALAAASLSNAGDTGNIDISGTAYGKRATRALLIDTILKEEKSGGGFALSGEEADPDITAMALTALAPYKDEEKVNEAIERGIALLSEKQNKNGGYTSYGSENSESTAQTIIALCTLGIDPDLDKRFIKDGKSLIDNLLSYQLKDGSFEHTKGGGSNLMATEQALCALDAYYRFTNSLSPLYDMTDVAEVAERLEKVAVKVTIDNKQVEFTSYTGRPFIDHASRTLAPIRQITENLGCDVSWDNSAKLAVITKDGTKVYITAGSSEIKIERAGSTETVLIDTAAQIKEDRTYIPLRAVVEAVGESIDWDNSSRTAVITRQ